MKLAIASLVAALAALPAGLFAVGGDDGVATAPRDVEGPVVPATGADAPESRALVSAVGAAAATVPAGAHGHAVPEAIHGLDDAMWRLRFEPNAGHAPAGVLMIARGPGGAVEARQQEVWFHAGNGPPMALRWHASDVGPAVAAAPVGLVELPSRFHAYVGQDATAWQTGRPQYEAIAYRDVAPGIDLVVRGTADGRPEFDHIVAPGADPAAIRFHVGGFPEVLPDGSLRTTSGDATWVLAAPVAFQPTRALAGGLVAPLRQGPDAGSHTIPVAFAVHPDGSVGYQLGPYDATRPLVIDPVVAYTTFLGTNYNFDSRDFARDIAMLQPAGLPNERHIYVGGDMYTASTYPPGFTGAAAIRHGPGTIDIAFIAKFSYNIQTQLVTPLWFAYIGGTGYHTTINGIAVDGNGNVGWGGESAATNYPVLNPILDPASGHDGSTKKMAPTVFTDAVVGVLGPTGSLQFSSYLGGGDPDTAETVAFAPNGNLVVGGRTLVQLYQNSGVLYPTRNAPQPTRSSTYGTYDGFLASINLATREFAFSTYLGSEAQDSVMDLVVDSTHVYAVGWTWANPSTPIPFPTTSGTYQQVPANPSGSGFVTKIGQNGGTAWTWSTLFGSNGRTELHSIALDALGNLWVAGTTQGNAFNGLCPASCPAGTVQANSGGSYDAFAARMPAGTGTVNYFTFHGGSLDEGGISDVGWSPWPVQNRNEIGIVHLGMDRFALLGTTSSTNLPLQAAVQTTLGGSTDIFVAIFDHVAGVRKYSTYVGGSGQEASGGGIAADSKLHIAWAGRTRSATFPATTGAVQATLSGTADPVFQVMHKAGPRAVIELTATGYPTALSGVVPVYNVLTGTAVNLRSVSVEGDFPIDVARNRWTLREGAVDVVAPAVGGNVPPFSPRTEGNIRLLRACLDVWDTDAVTGMHLTNGTCIDIAWGNLPPVAADDLVDVPEDSVAFDLGVITNDVDPNGQVVRIVSVDTSGLTVGTVAFDPMVDDRRIFFTPPADYFTPGASTLSFGYRVTDGVGGFDNATVRMRVLDINDLPTAAADAAVTNEDTPVDIDVLANDLYAPDPLETLVLHAVSNPPRGSAAIVAGQARYTPDPDLHGPDSFTYTIHDGRGGWANGTVSIVVNPVNDPPIAVPDSASVPEDGNGLIDVLANDHGGPDGTEALQVSAVGPASSGTAVIEAGQVRYTPAPNFQGVATFTYTARDPGGLTAVAIVTVTVPNTNDAPVAAPDALVVAEDAAATTVPVLANDHSGPDPPEALAVVAAGPASHGTVQIVGGQVEYTPAPDFHGPDSFPYTIQDPGGLGASSTVTVTVTPVNDPPVAVDDAFPAYPGIPDQPLAVLLNDHDVDHANAQLRAVLDSWDPADGTLVVGPDQRTLLVTPSRLGTIFAGYRASDGLVQGNVAQVALTVGLPPAPLIMLDADPDRACQGRVTRLRGIAMHAGHQAETWTWTIGGAAPHVVSSATNHLDHVHTFADIGTTQVRLDVLLRSTSNPAATQTLTTTLPLQVDGCALPVARFAVDILNLNSQFRDLSHDPDGTLVAWAWDFGDGATSTLRNPSHAYARAGTYPVLLVVTDNEGDQGTYLIVVPATAPEPVAPGAVPGGVVAVPEPPAAPAPAVPDPNNRPPVAVVAGPASARAGDRIVLVATGSHDPDGDPLTYGWRQASGPRVVLADAGGAVEFRAPIVGPAGETVAFELEVSDGRALDVALLEIPVLAPETPPVANFLAGAQGEVVRFQDRSLAGSDATFAWEFGDGQTSTERSPTHVYPAPGEYLVTLRVTDARGTAEIVQSLRVVAELPEPQDVHGRTSGMAPAKAQSMPGTAWLAMGVVAGLIIVGTLALLVMRRR